MISHDEQINRNKKLIWKFIFINLPAQTLASID